MYVLCHNAVYNLIIENVVDTLKCNTQLTAIFSTTWLSQYQSVCILDFVGAKEDGGGGDNGSCET